MLLRELVREKELTAMHQEWVEKSFFFRKSPLQKSYLLLGSQKTNHNTSLQKNVSANSFIV
jgi:hypothetical protein